MSKLFSYRDVRNKPSRDGFDLQQHLAFTAKPGELLPVYQVLTMPGDTYTCKTEHFTRTMPMQSAAYVRVKENFDWFFVPLRLLWKSFESSITLMQNNPVQAKSVKDSLVVSSQMPYVNLSMLLSLSGGALHNLWQHDNYFGMNRSVLALKLFNHLEYCNIPDDYLSPDYDETPVLSRKEFYGQDVPVDLWSLAAYHKIYNDYYRNSQWEDASPYLWNFDYSEGGKIDLPGGSDGYWNGQTIFDIHYANFPKDLFFGILPSSQYGNVAEVEVLGTGAEQLAINIPSLEVNPLNIRTVANRQSDSQRVFKDLRITPTSGTEKTGLTLSIIDPTDINSVADVDSNFSTSARTEGTVPKTLSVELPSSVTSTFSILQLRMQQCLQKWREISLTGRQDYRDQIQKHFGVSLPPEMSDLCEFIDGDVTPLQIGAVVNQSFGENDTEKTFIKGTGTANGSSYFKFSCKEVGILMCVYHAAPTVDYNLSGINPMHLKTEAYDYAMPEFDRIGFEELPFIVMFNRNPRLLDGFGDTETLDFAKTIGYVPRYYDYKTKIDRVIGDFNVSLKDWTAAVDDDYINRNLIRPAGGDARYFQATYNFFKVSPNILDNVFAVNADSYCNTDPFRVNAFFDVKAVRNLDYSGLPY